MNFSRAFELWVRPQTDGLNQSVPNPSAPNPNEIMAPDGRTE